MLVFTDIITGDEIFSDSFPRKLIDDIVWEVDCQMIPVKDGADTDIGANPSAEEAGEDVEDGVRTVNNVVDSFRLNPTTFDRNTYLTHLKGYVQSVRRALEELRAKPEEVAAFEKGAAAYTEKIVGNFEAYEFFLGESRNPDGMVGLLSYREDGITPYLTFWKHGLKEQKL
ncbi:translationally-controlled tumor protein [Streptomyces sp. NPDC021356]|uniref:translationally-controlled tumor protein n=1 Tax=Streptomyces sp. NPDC021356 TaxID=3154900 RepID=UPI0033DDFD8C